jgi:hypothetical protein
VGETQMFEQITIFDSVVKVFHILFVASDIPVPK